MSILFTINIITLCIARQSVYNLPLILSHKPPPMVQLRHTKQTKCWTAPKVIIMFRTGFADVFQLVQNVKHTIQKQLNSHC